ncbi:MFS transporter [Thalassotalea sp. 1_MG-2023]|uniref:MFS transporter n=1 Tax=Thalassotalea sp. 1_MG-2023 TaxID=3062680 RepID=UPI0026E27DC2|nr:MFS transporter [Thalassotalea sp. 1_MG-2023]MDO6425539.1 MFS transporter [Thalassotalea sp. 1_MG-2023]
MKTNYTGVALVLITFFAISFITNILGPLFPSLVQDFDISLAVAGFLPFSFFAAYGVMSIPSGILVDKYGEKFVMLAAFVMAATGSFLFALNPSFFMAMGSLFLVGTGMAMLQVAINPLLRVSGGQEHFAFYSVLAQLLFGGAATLSPIVYSNVVQSMATGETSGIIGFFNSNVPANMSWLSMYWIFAAVSVAMLILIALIKLPKVELKEDEAVGAIGIYKQLLKNKSVILFFIGIAAYVGTEQGVANAISIFLERYHGLNPVTVGAETVSEFWLMLTIGCLLGLVLVKLLDSRLVLKLFSGGAMIALSFALFGSAEVSVIAFPLVGFFLSVMWSVIFSLALNSVAEHHGSFAGILCTGIVGGGLASPLIGVIADLTDDLRIGMVVVYITLAYIFAIGFWAKPLVVNKTIKLFNKPTADSTAT